MLSLIPGVIPINLRAVGGDIQVVEAVLLIPVALPGKPASLQVKDNEDFWKIWENRFLPVSLIKPKRGSNTVSSLLPCTSKVPSTGSLGTGQTPSPYGCKCPEAKEVFLLFEELHVSHLPSLSASQDLFPYALLHSYSAHSQRSHYSPLFIY